jgi:hypothetical protein
MIVLDEHLHDARLEFALARWYPGQIVQLKLLRPRTLIKDDAVPSLLRQLKQPTFVTINWSDFGDKLPLINDTVLFVLR